MSEYQKECSKLKKIVFMGHFNGQHLSWDSDSTNINGETRFDFMTLI